MDQPKKSTKIPSRNQERTIAAAQVWYYSVKNSWLDNRLKMHISWVVPLPRMQSSPPGWWTIFRLGDPNLNLHLPQLLGGGTTQHISYSIGIFHCDVYQHTVVSEASEYHKGKWFQCPCTSPQRETGGLGLYTLEIQWAVVKNSRDLNNLGWCLSLDMTSTMAVPLTFWFWILTIIGDTPTC